MVALPYASSVEALAYLTRENVDFIVVDSRYMEYLPELGEWIEHGIPDPRAQLIYQNGTDSNEIQIYRWANAESHPGAQVGIRAGRE